MLKETKILIVGAGIAGSVCALALEKKGFRPDIIELRPRHVKVRSSITLQGAGMSVAKKLGVYEDIEKLSANFKRYIISTKEDSVLKNIDMSNLEFNSTTAPREFFTQTFLNQLKYSKVVHKEKVSSFEEKENGILVHFISGQSKLYDIIIGADGVHSQTRKHFFPNSKEYYTGGLLIGFEIPQGIALPPISEVAEKWGNRCMFGYYGMRNIDGEPTHAIAFCLKCEQKPKKRLSDTQVKKILLDNFSDFKNPLLRQILNNLPSIDEMYVSFMTNVPATNTWFNSRVCLLGDAAHAILPTAGMGASLASIGAYKLADAIATEAIAKDAFQKYHKSHLPFVQKIQKEGLLLLKIMTASRPWSKVRNFVLKITPSSVFTDRLQNAGQQEIIN